MTSVRAEQMTAILVAGPGAALVCSSAAALLGLLPQDAPPHHVGRPRGRANVVGVRAHRAKLPPEDLTVVDGIRVTTPARTLLDLAETEPLEVVARALGEAEVRQLVSRRQLVAQLGRWTGRRGLRPLRELIGDELEAAPTRSVLEDRFLSLVRAAGLPRPEMNVRVHRVQVDAYWRAQRLAVELDGRRFHNTDMRFERDRARDTRLAAAGVVTLRFTWRRLRREPLAVAAELAAALALREAAA